MRGGCPNRNLRASGFEGSEGIVEEDQKVVNERRNPYGHAVIAIVWTQNFKSRSGQGSTAEP